MRFFNRIKKNKITNSTETTDVLLKALLNNETITREKALTLPIISSDVDFISGSIACMPVKLYKINGKGQSEEIKDDIRIKLLNGDTGDTLDAFQMKKAMIEDYLLGKGGYAVIQKNGNTVSSINYVPDNNVSYLINNDVVNKDVKFQIGTKTYKTYEIIKLLRNTKNGAYGIGLITEISKAIETAYGMLVFQLNLVKSGGNKKGFLQSNHNLKQEHIDALREAWKKLYSNNEENIVILNDGLTFKESSNSSVEMQLNESKKTLENEIDRVFHISNDFNLTFKMAILPIVRAFESALNSSMLLEKEKKNKYFEFDTNVITQATKKERYETYKLAKEAGFLSVNEMRQDDGLNVIDGLDVINMSLGSVLYDTNKQTYYTPNTGATKTSSENEIKEDEKELADGDKKGGENGEKDEIL